MLTDLYKSEHRAAVPTEVAAKALGHTGVSQRGRLSGPALGKLAALRQYGLVETPSKGKVKVADSALDFVLHGPDEPEYRKAARIAALTPTIFAELYPEYAKASDNALRARLIKERQFSTEGANRFIKAFRDTLAFAKLGGESYNEPREETRTPGSSSRSVMDDAFAATFDERDARMAFNWLLPGGVAANLAFPGRAPTPKAIDRLIDYLKFMKADLPIEEPEQSADHLTGDEANS
ncbi:MAG: hypothetical protein ACREMP_10585 [Candidatus Tyrphobacter sp.]